MRRYKAAAIIVSLVLVAAACEKVRVQTYGPTNTSSSNQAVLTPDGPNNYRFVSVPANMAVASIDSAGGNLRQLFWPADNPLVPDSESCAIWGAESGPLVQQGAALRITQSGSRIRAISVTKNVFYGATWIFNFHLWDTALSPAFTLIGATNLQSTLVHNGVVTPLPWSFCARVIGSKLEFKVWPVAEPLEPAWGDPTHGGSVTLPAGWSAPGKAGWYIGHIQPNTTAVFTNLSTYKWVDP
ncbi:MAG TPA: hypothetical protein VGN59_08200 [Acidimicrobiia bacterium]|jgi:hypothetical protein